MKLKYSLLILIVLMVSCKSKQAITKSKATKNIEIEQVVDLVQKKQPHFKTANVSKMSLLLDMNSRELNVSATCKVSKDSLIQISIQPFLGIELFKADLMPSSVLVIDKMNRRYFEVDYSFFKSRFGVEVDFYSLQSLLFGQLFCIGNKEVQTDKCTLNMLSGGNKSIGYETDNMQQSTEISVQNFIQQVVLIAKESNYQLNTAYSDYIELNGVNFPQKIALKATNQKTNVKCDFSILRVEFDKPVRFSASDIEKYSKGNIEQLLTK